MWFISESQAMCLWEGRDIRSERVLMTHPRMVFISDSPPSARSLLRASGFSRGIGSSDSSGRQSVWITSGATAANLSFAPSVSGPTTIMSSM